MVSMTSILAMATLVATTVDYVKAHGYVKDPPCNFVGNKTNSDWGAEMSPLWLGDWNTCKNDEDMLAMFKKLGAANNYKDLRTLMDGNPAFGKDCGYTDPKAKPVAPPSNGQATFSRGIVHPGPCAIYLDDKLVFHSEDCKSSTGDGTLETISIFKPVDYSSCAPSGCMFRFYWLALQRLNKQTLWQSYKNCIPLTGPSGGGGGAKDVSQEELSDVTQEELSDVSQEELLGNSNVSQNTTSKSKDTSANAPKDLKKESNESEDTKKESNESKDTKKESNESKDTKKKSNESKDTKKESNGSKEEANESNESKKESNKTPPAGRDSSQTPPAKEPPQTPPAEASTQAPPAGANSQKPPPETPESPSAFLPGTPAMTPAPSSKCKGHRRRRY